MSAEMTFNLQQLNTLRSKIKPLSGSRKRVLLDTLGSEIEDQVVARIESGGPAPDGEDWPDWSDAYGETRGPGKALLRDEGELLTSVQFEITDDDTLDVGSNLEYAAVHQYGHDFGTFKVQARPYLGLSLADENAVEALALTFLEKEILEARP